MPDLSELEHWVNEQKRQWIERMKVTNPEHAKYYCPDHGEYIGFNELSPCKQCMQLKTE